MFWVIGAVNAGATVVALWVLYWMWPGA